MPGPLPQPTRRRRNAPTIPTTQLPLAGRPGAAPPVPEWCPLGKAGRSWWRWAWSTPQAAAWGTGVGMEGVVARRAALEDSLAASEDVQGLDLDGLDAARAQEVRMVVGQLASLVTGRMTLVREMRELDDRLGLTPKGMAQL